MKEKSSTQVERKKKSTCKRNFELKKNSQLEIKIVILRILTGKKTP